MSNQNPYNIASQGLVWPLWIITFFFSAIFIFISLDNIISRSGWGPDDQLRMVQIRDFLAGQSWFDWTQYRMNTPEGAPMHWSRFIELPLALIIFILTPILGQDIAEMVAGSLIPLIGLTLTSYMIGRITMAIWNRQAAIFAILLTWINPAISFQFNPMRIDHHGWQIMLATLALWTMFWPSKRNGGIILGIALSTWLHISLEGLPITAAFFVLLGWRWIVAKAHGQRLIWAITSFALSTFFLYIITQGLPFNAAIYCDSISPAYLDAIGIASIIMLIAINATLPRRWMRFAASAIAGASALMILINMAPECSGGAFAQLDPLVYEYWYLNINEGQPIWQQQLKMVLLVSALPAMAIIALFVITPKIFGPTRFKLHMIGFFILYSALLSCLVFRTITVANAFAVPLIAFWIAELFHKYQNAPNPFKRISLVLAMLFLIITGPIISSLGAFIAPHKDQTNANNVNTANIMACKSANGLKPLNKLPTPSNIVAPFDLSTLILLNSEHHVLASSHHRNANAMHDQIAIMIGSPEQAFEIIKKRKITHIVTCPQSPEWKAYQTRHKDSMADRLIRGNTPDWLVTVPNQDNILIWRIATNL